MGQFNELMLDTIQTGQTAARRLYQNLPPILGCGWSVETYEERLDMTDWQRQHLVGLKHPDAAIVHKTEAVTFAVGLSVSPPPNLPTTGIIYVER